MLRIGLILQSSINIQLIPTKSKAGLKVYNLGKQVIKKIDVVKELINKGYFDVVVDKLSRPMIDEILMEKTMGMDSLFDEVWKCVEDQRARIIGLYECDSLPLALVTIRRAMASRTMLEDWRELSDEIGALISLRYVNLSMMLISSLSSLEMYMSLTDTFYKVDAKMIIEELEFLEKIIDVESTEDIPPGLVSLERYSLGCYQESTEDIPPGLVSLERGLLLEWQPEQCDKDLKCSELKDMG
ncbi:hypothetical protein EZV62_011619 [Acer yangbiense]|uniref:NB-ARC domain-containing protein n=1 Tax=Acer yangbiense TaxID=1000413 RepID=A0A5C7I684_9ROSI|nr:hypothetical protein EZV62_011619 [Acer yangbiense]